LKTRAKIESRQAVSFMLQLRIRMFNRSNDSSRSSREESGEHVSPCLIKHNRVKSKVSYI